MPIFIDDTPAISVLEARAKARRLYREYGIGLIVVDYLQLMSGQAKTSSREREILYISRRLKDLAEELDLPVLVLVQLSFAEDSLMEPRPRLADLSALGVEQAADVVMFIYRPGMYGLTAPDGESLESLAEIIIDKQRNGPPCSVTLKWNADVRDLRVACALGVPCSGGTRRIVCTSSTTSRNPFEESMSLMLATSVAVATSAYPAAHRRSRAHRRYFPLPDR